MRMARIRGWLGIRAAELLPELRREGGEAMTEQCANCRFWERGAADYGLGDRDEYGTCRRYPTHVLKREDGWCGEWTPNAMAVIERMGKETYEPRTS